MQCGVAMLVLLVRLGSVPDEKVGDRGMVYHCGYVQWCLAGFIVDAGVVEAPHVGVNHDISDVIIASFYHAVEEWKFFFLVEVVLSFC